MMNPLRLLFLVHANTRTGFGHFYRSLALARAAQARGHRVYIASDRTPPAGLIHIPTTYNDPVTFASALKVARPDWVIVDVPHTPPEWVRGLVKGRICTLNGIGYNQNDGADLRVIQGVGDLELPGPQDKVPVLKGLEYVILRPEIEQYRGMVRGEDYVIWEGAYPTDLLNRFPAACPGTVATLLVSAMKVAPPLLPPTQTWVRPNPETAEIFGWLAGAKAVVTDFGMICMESAAYLGIPTYAFSATPLHLLFAKGLERYGLIKAWPEVGLPSNAEIKAFVKEPFEVDRANMIDTRGAERVMEVIENYG